MKRGFSFPELLMVMGIIAILSTFMVTNLLNTQRKVNIATSVSKIVGDFKHQQLKSMMRDTDGQTTSDYYGVYFEPTRYTLFRGSSYSAGNTSNFVVDLDGAQLSSIGQVEIIFASGSGEINGFGNNQKTITIFQGTAQKIITINKFGVVTNIN